MHAEAIDDFLKMNREENVEGHLSVTEICEILTNQNINEHFSKLLSSREKIENININSKMSYKSKSIPRITAFYQ
ncbi:6577_t:CDS:1, partial [Scutellospora calospora]